MPTDMHCLCIQLIKNIQLNMRRTCKYLVERTCKYIESFCCCCFKYIFKIENNKCCGYNAAGLVQGITVRIFKFCKMGDPQKQLKIFLKLLKLQQAYTRHYG